MNKAEHGASGGTAAAVADRDDERLGGDGADASSGCCMATHDATGQPFAVQAGQVLLDAGLEAGVDMDFGCRVGACGACAVEVVDGLENALPPDPIEADSLRRYCLPRSCRLACRTRLSGPITFRRTS
jgi:ferredoxin